MSIYSVLIVAQKYIKILPFIVKLDIKKTANK